MRNHWRTFHIIALLILSGNLYAKEQKQGGGEDDEGGGTGNTAMPDLKNISDLAVTVPGHVPIKPGEHPRLYFRKSDLPEIRKRAETPEGKAIIERLKVLLGGGETMPTAYNPAKKAYDAKYDAPYGSFTNSHAAGFGLLFQITGDKKYAELGKQCFEKAFAGQRNYDDRYSWKVPGGALRAGPSLGSYALGYDLCYDGWDEDFRQKIAKAFESYNEGPNMSIEELAAGKRQMPTCNHWGYVGGAGIALMAIKGDPGVDTARIDKLIEINRKSITRQLTEGWGDHGWFPEGDGPGAISSDTVFMPSLQAYRVCLGLDYTQKSPAAHWMSLKWVYLTLGGTIPGRGTYQHNIWERTGSSGSGQFPQGFGILQPDQQAALLWTYEHEFKEKDEKAQMPFDTVSHYPHRAVLALINWPFGMQSKNPGELLPCAVQDKKWDYYMFRNRWQDKDDIIINALTRGTKGNYSCPGGDVLIWGLGKKTSFPAKLMGTGGIFKAGKTNGTIKFGNISFGVDFSGACGCPGLVVMTGASYSGKSDFPTTTVSVGGTNFLIQFITKDKAPEVKTEGDKVIVGGQTISLQNGVIMFSK